MTLDAIANPLSSASYAKLSSMGSVCIDAYYAAYPTFL
jgi:hypothetical protein